MSISGLKETFIKRYIDERTNKEKIRTEEESEKTESVRIIMVGWLVSWCFQPSQPQKITSKLRDTFVKKCTVERTSRAELRPEEQSEKAELSGEFME